MSNKVVPLAKGERLDIQRHALPPHALAMVRSYQAQIQALQAQQQAYTTGVLAGLGIVGPVKLNLETGAVEPVPTPESSIEEFAK